jgi:hypothetical protein
VRPSSTLTSSRIWAQNYQNAQTLTNAACPAAADTSPRLSPKSTTICRRTRLSINIRSTYWTLTATPNLGALPTSLTTSSDRFFAIGEAECSSIPQHPRSESLHKAIQKVRYWKTFITARTTGVCQDQVLDDLASEIWPDGPPTPPVNNYILRKVKIATERALKRTRRDGDKERKAFLRELLVRKATRVAPSGISEAVALKKI